MKGRSRLERRNLFCESLGDPERNAAMASLPCEFVKGVVRPWKGEGRGPQALGWIGWESPLGDNRHTSRAGKRRVSPSSAGHPGCSFQAVFSFSVIRLSICPSTHIAICVSKTNAWQQAGSPTLLPLPATGTHPAWSQRLSAPGQELCPPCNRQGRLLGGGI